ncbi:hypothetical protein CXB40_30290 [Pseudomonas syringae pv. avii]|nr:hypothetical protein PSYMP_24611 [Pseudomonas amygdali pv. morsprunorum str. M302280]KWT06142.1 hypothetical protein AL046_23690 [Pseudomonas syringae pv. avii]POC99829.1 hypothetical protein BKM20_27130 [Pseudomonas avellanae]POP75805.1 hypothetical protein CXB34_27920 [Pseudomonas amygdali pv. morsprunorum]POP89160.1 hypothetical protein CXB40_30290 [Pseudomonas syringae pv. avii]
MTVWFCMLRQIVVRQLNAPTLYGLFPDGQSIAARMSCEDRQGVSKTPTSHHRSRFSALALGGIEPKW